MLSNTVYTATLLNGIEQVNTDLLHLLRSATDEALHFKVAARSWCIAQIAEHVLLSTNSVLKAITLKGNKAQRNSAEKIKELKQIFLDFTKKYDAPAFIQPTKDIYTKAVLVNELETTFAALQQVLYNIEFDELIDHPAFGNISKLEIAHFVWFHTQRHLRQMNERLQQYSQQQQPNIFIELFKTNISKRKDAASIIEQLNAHYPFSKITIDLHDCDKILRIEGEQVQPLLITNVLHSFGYNGSVFT